MLNAKDVGKDLISLYPRASYEARLREAFQIQQDIVELEHRRMALEAQRDMIIQDADAGRQNHDLLVQELTKRAQLGDIARHIVQQGEEASQALARLQSLNPHAITNAPSSDPGHQSAWNTAQPSGHGMTALQGRGSAAHSTPNARVYSNRNSTQQPYGTSRQNVNYYPNHQHNHSQVPQSLPGSYAHPQAPVHQPAPSYSHYTHQWQNIQHPVSTTPYVANNATMMVPPTQPTAYPATAYPPHHPSRMDPNMTGHSARVGSSATKAPLPPKTAPRVTEGVSQPIPMISKASTSTNSGASQSSAGSVQLIAALRGNIEAEIKKWSDDAAIGSTKQLLANLTLVKGEQGVSIVRTQNGKQTALTSWDEVVSQLQASKHGQPQPDGTALQNIPAPSDDPPHPISTATVAGLDQVTPRTPSQANRSTLARDILRALKRPHDSEPNSSSNKKGKSNGSHLTTPQSSFTNIGISAAPPKIRAFPGPPTDLNAAPAAAQVDILALTPGLTSSNRATLSSFGHHQVSLNITTKVSTPSVPKTPPPLARDPAKEPAAGPSLGPSNHAGSHCGTVTVPQKPKTPLFLPSPSPPLIDLTKDDENRFDGDQEVEIVDSDPQSPPPTPIDRKGKSAMHRLPPTVDNPTTHPAPSSTFPPYRPYSVSQRLPNLSTGVATANQAGGASRHPDIDSSMTLIPPLPRASSSNTQSTAVNSQLGGHVRSSTAVKQRGRPRVYVLVPPAPYLKKRIKQKDDSALKSQKKQAPEDVSLRRGGRLTKVIVDPREQEAVDEAFSRIRELRCRWHNCEVVMNTTNRMLVHLRVHGEEQQTQQTFWCLWQHCGQHFIDSAGLQNHMEDHARVPIYCAYEKCSETFRSTRQLLQHNLTVHKGHILRPSADLIPLAKPADLPACPLTMPSWMVIPRVIYPARVSQARQDQIAPDILRLISAPVRFDPAQPLQSPSKGGRTRQSRAAEEDSELLWSYSARPSKPARLRGLPDLNSGEVTQLAVDGRILFRGKEEEDIEGVNNDVESEDELALPALRAGGAEVKVEEEEAEEEAVEQLLDTEQAER